MAQARSVVKELNQEVKQSDVEHVGTMVTLSVQMGESKLRYNDIKNMIINDPVIPNRWAPKNRNKLTMYLDCVNKLKNTQSLSKFENHLDKFPFDPHKEHAAYMGVRTDYSKHSKFPVTHNILHIRKSEEINEFDQQRLESNEAFPIQLERVEGSAETDDSTSKFMIRFPGDVPQQYIPFLHALHDMFRERVNRVYDSGAIRGVVNNLLRDKMNAESVKSSLYFIHDENIDALEALRAGFKRLHPGIDLFMFHVPHYKDKPADAPVNRTFKSVSTGVTNNILQEVKEFHAEIVERINDEETDTRPSTWTKRAQELKEIQKRMQKLENKQMLISDTLKKMVNDTRNKIREQI